MGFTSLLEHKLEYGEVSWDIIATCVHSADYLVYEMLYCILFKVYYELSIDTLSISEWYKQHQLLFLLNITTKQQWFSLILEIAAKNEKVFISSFIDSCVMREKSDKNNVLSILFQELFIEVLPQHLSLLQSVYWLLNNRFYLLPPSTLSLLCNAICHYCKEEIVLSLFNSFSSHYDNHSLLISLCLLYYSLVYQTNYLLQAPSLSFVMERSYYVNDIEIQLVRSRCILYMQKKMQYSFPLWVVHQNSINIPDVMKYVTENKESFELVAEIVAIAVVCLGIDVSSIFYDHDDLTESFRYCVYIKLATINSGFIPTLLSLTTSYPVGLLPFSFISECMNQKCSISFLLHAVEANPTLSPHMVQQSSWISTLLSNGSSEAIHLLCLLLDGCKREPCLLQPSLIPTINSFCSETLVKESQLSVRMDLHHILGLLTAFYHYPMTPTQMESYSKELMNTLQRMDLFQYDVDYPAVPELRVFYDKQDLSKNALFLISLLPSPSSFIPFAQFKGLITGEPKETIPSHYAHLPIEEEEVDSKKRRKQVFENMLKQIKKIAQKNSIPQIVSFPFLSSGNVAHFIEYCIVLLAKWSINSEKKQRSFECFHVIRILLSEANTVDFLNTFKQDELIKHTVSTVLSAMITVLNCVAKDYKEYALCVSQLEYSLKDIRELLLFLKEEISVKKISKQYQSVESALSSVECIYRIV